MKVFPPRLVSKTEPLQKMILSVHCAQDVTGLNRKKLMHNIDLWQALVILKDKVKIEKLTTQYLLIYMLTFGKH